MKKSLLVTILFFSVFSLYAQHPVNLTSSNVTSNSVELSWTDNGCNTFYKLRYREAGGSWHQILVFLMLRLHIHSIT